MAGGGNRRRVQRRARAHGGRRVGARHVRQRPPGHSRVGRGVAARRRRPGAHPGGPNGPGEGQEEAVRPVRVAAARGRLVGRRGDQSAAPVDPTRDALNVRQGSAPAAPVAH